jgi:hypothetical protein
VLGQYAFLVPELLVNIAHIGKVNEGELGQSQIQTRPLKMETAQFPRTRAVLRTLARRDGAQVLGEGPSLDSSYAPHGPRSAECAQVRSRRNCSR